MKVISAGSCNHTVITLHRVIALQISLALSDANWPGRWREETFER